MGNIDPHPILWRYVFYQATFKLKFLTITISVKCFWWAMRWQSMTSHSLSEVVNPDCTLAEIAKFCSRIIWASFITSHGFSSQLWRALKKPKHGFLFFRVFFLSKCSNFLSTAIAFQPKTLKIFFFRTTKKMVPITLVCNAGLLRNLAFFDENLCFKW